MAGSLWVLDHVSWAKLWQLCLVADSRSDSTKIDTVKRKYELLTPSPGRLPSRVAIVGSVEWIEEM